MSSALDPEVPRGGNTITPLGTTKKQISPAKNWCFTWNNYPDEWEEILVPKFQSSGHFGMKPEIGKSGTKHIQGWVSFDVKLRPSSLKLPKEIHWEKMKGTIQDSIDYCMKADTADGDYVTNKKIPKKLPIVELYGWQKSAESVIKKEPDNRTIFWIWSREGGRGKSTFVRYLCQNMGAIICAGKASDMKFQIVKYIERNDGCFPEIIVFDVPRSMENYLSYTGIEEIKNGVFASNKYESDMVIMPHPHVVVLANFSPDLNNKDMSSDRFEIWNIDRSDIECPNYLEDDI